MPSASRCMTAFGVFALVCAIAGWTTGEAAIRSGIATGVAMFAAAAAAAQRRTSLRKTGHFVGIFLPVIIAGFCGWWALDHWRTLGTDDPRPYAAVLLSLLSLGGAATAIMLMKLRSADRIAERGYAVQPLSSTSADTSRHERFDRE